jgi:hypothetical protein
VLWDYRENFFSEWCCSREDLMGWDKWLGMMVYDLRKDTQV